MEQALEREDPAQAEKKLESQSSSIHNTHPSEVERVDQRLWLSEEDALARVRSRPDDAQPIYVMFSPQDRDNPRNWQKWKKWYITCFASMLNILTYVLSSAPNVASTVLTRHVDAYAPEGILLASINSSRLLGFLQKSELSGYPCIFSVSQSGL